MPVIFKSDYEKESELQMNQMGSVNNESLSTVNISLLEINTQLSDIAKEVANITVDTTPLSGTAFADATANTITLVGHGLTAGIPIEFIAGTGVIPSGLVADAIYYVYNVIGNTFQLVPLVESTSVIDITSTGTAGFQIKRNDTAFVQITGLDITAHNGEYDIYVYQKLATVASTTNWVLELKINLNAVNNVVMSGNNGISNVMELFGWTVLINKKYIRAAGKINIKFIPSFGYFLKSDVGGHSIAGDNSILSISNNQAGYTTLTDNLTSITISKVGSWICNGSRIIIKRVK